MQKKIAFIFILFLTASWIHAQIASPKIYSGFNGFVLNNTLEMYGSGIEFVDTLTYKGNTEYHYVNRFKPDYAFADVKFKDVILTFNKEDILTRIELPKIYTHSLFKNPKKQWADDRASIIKYLNSQTGSKGIKQKRNSMPYYEWVRAEYRITMFYQHQPAQDSGKESYGVTIDWEKK
jgi:hypothetical protein